MTSMGIDTSAAGIGREGSKYEVDDWLELKYFTMAGL